MRLGLICDKCHRQIARYNDIIRQDITNLNLHTDSLSSN